MRTRRFPGLATWTVGVIVLGVAGVARPAAGAPPTTQAPALTGAFDLGILEVRSGSTELPGLGSRLAVIARKATSLRIAGPDDARKRAGTDVDAAVARCAGEAPCLAGVAERVGARSLLVVAVSQLGDVMVGLQLVEVGSREGAGRLAHSLPAGEGLDDAQLRGWLERLLPRNAFILYGILSIGGGDLDGATVEVDGQPRGLAPLSPLRLKAPALYQLRITKPGRKSFGMTVDLQPERTVEVLASLPPADPGAGTPLYKRPWVWAALLAGVAAGTFAGVRWATPNPTTVDGAVTVTHP